MPFACHAVTSLYAKSVSSNDLLIISGHLTELPKGQESLPQACPVCLHEPVNKDDCRPNKALRTTIKVFLKKKAVEREAARKKEMLALAAATPTTPATPIIEETWARQPSATPADPTTGPQLSPSDVKREAGVNAHSLEAVNSLGNIPLQSSMDIPQQSIEVSEHLTCSNRSSPRD